MMMRYRRNTPVETWEDMKEKLKLKYVPLSFSPVVTGQVKSVNSNKQIGHRIHC